MRRPNPVRERGFGLLAFVLLTAIVAFTLVVGYAGVMTRKEASRVPARQEAYLRQVALQVEQAWRASAYVYDAPGPSNSLTAEQVLTAAGVVPQYGLQAALSNVRVSDGIAYRSLVVYLPAETDESNPPNLASFRSTGEFQSCSNTSQECATRSFLVFSSLDLQRELTKETQARLNKLAFKAQGYFKARMLLDPERNVSVNYFRKPMGACEVMDNDLGCMDTYQPLVVLGGPSSYSRTRMATALGLTDEELFSAWGYPIEASNLQDSVTDDAPYTMAFRAARPSGGFLTVKAVQQL